MDTNVLDQANADPARVLRAAVRSAQEAVLRGGWEQASVNETLSDLLDALAPVYEQLEAIAAADPTSAVAAVLAHLGRAYGLAIDGFPESAIASVITAAVTSVRLTDDDLLATDAADLGRWR